MQTLPLSDVKVRLSEIADEVNRTHERVHITRNGREYVVLMSADDLASMEATLELLADPAVMAKIRDRRGREIAVAQAYDDFYGGRPAPLSPYVAALYGTD